MQLSKPFNLDENFIYGDQIIREGQYSPSPPSPMHQSSNGQHNIHSGHTRNIQNMTNQIKFFQEYKKIYNVAYHLYVEKIRLANLHKQLTRKITILQDRFRDREEKESKKLENSSQENKMKRSRRTAEMIQKKYRCNVEFCERLYGSEGSLQQHIKLKHPQLYRTPDNGSQAYSEEFNDSL